MKKLFAILLTLMLLVGCAACGNKNDAPIVPTPDTNNTPIAAAEGMYRAMGEKDVEKLVSYLPEYNFTFLAAMGRANGMGPEEGQTDKEFVTNLLEEQVLAELDENPVKTMDIKGEELAEADYPADLVAELREALADDDAPEGLDASVLDEIEDVAWVKLSGTVTYEDGTEETLGENEVTIPCVKIDGKWYVDLFSTLFLAIAHPAPAPEVSY